MKIKISFKDPDAVYDAIRGTAEDQVFAIEGLTEDEAESLIRERHNQISQKLRKWIRFNEDVEIEFDIDGQKATVVTVN